MPERTVETGRARTVSLAPAKVPLNGLHEPTRMTTGAGAVSGLGGVSRCRSVLPAITERH